MHLSQPDLRRLIRLLIGALVGSIVAIVLMMISRSGSWGRLLIQSQMSKGDSESEDEENSEPVEEVEDFEVESVLERRVALDDSISWLEAYAVTHQGRVREENQDSFDLSPLGEGQVLALVADGMGGHSGGALASDIAVKTISGLIHKLDSNEPEKMQVLLADSFARADTAIRHRASKDTKVAGMGTTAVGAVVTPDYAIHAYTGDSRLYHFRKGELLYRTKDHSVVRYLEEEGLVTEAEARVHPMRSRLTSSLGGSPPERKILVEPEWDANIEGDQPCMRNFHQGDLLLLCSDGLNSEVEPGTIEELVREQHTDLRKLVTSLLNAALESGGRDNITIIVLKRR